MSARQSWASFALALALVALGAAGVRAEEPDAGVSVSDVAAPADTVPAPDDDTAIAPVDDAAMAPDDAQPGAGADALPAAPDDASEPSPDAPEPSPDTSEPTAREPSVATPESTRGPPAGAAPAPNESEPPRGDVSLEALMPTEAERAPEDLDGDGRIAPAEAPIPFGAGAYGKGYSGRLKALIERLRERIITKLVVKTTAKQGKAMSFVMLVMLGLSAAGVLILFAPLFLRRRYPGREKLLWKGAGLAAAAWVSTMLVFTGALFVLRSVRNETALLASPSLAVAEAAFDAAYGQVDFLAEDAPVILEAPIAKVAAGRAGGLIEAVLENVARFRSDLGGFRLLSDLFAGLNAVLGAVGAILLLYGVYLFMRSQKHVLGDILGLPKRAAAGDAASFGATYAAMQRRTLREVAALLSTIGLVVAAALFSGLVLYVAIGPAVATLFDYVVYNIYYILGSSGASRVVVYTSLIGVGLFLGLVILAVLLANTYFLGTAQKILQQKFRHRLPLAATKTFWRWGPIAAMWVQLLPVLFIVVAHVLVDALVAVKRGEVVGWGGLLLTGPLVLVVGLPIFVWLLQGFRALAFLKKFDHLAGSPERPRPASTAE